jgi:hypothetical protein
MRILNIIFKKTSHNIEIYITTLKINCDLFFKDCVSQQPTLNQMETSLVDMTCKQDLPGLNFENRSAKSNTIHSNGKSNIQLFLLNII